MDISADYLFQNLEINSKNLNQRYFVLDKRNKNVVYHPELDSVNRVNVTEGPVGLQDGDSHLPHLVDGTVFYGLGLVGN